MKIHFMWLIDIITEFKDIFEEVQMVRQWLGKLMQQHARRINVYATHHLLPLMIMKICSFPTHTIIVLFYGRKLQL